MPASESEKKKKKITLESEEEKEGISQKTQKKKIQKDIQESTQESIQESSPKGAQKSSQKNSQKNNQKSVQEGKKKKAGEGAGESQRAASSTAKKASQASSSATKKADARKKAPNPPVGFLSLLTLALCVALTGLGVKLFHFIGSTQKEKQGNASLERSTAIEEEEESLFLEEEESPAPDPYADKPQVDLDSWELLLANPTHSVADYEPQVEALEDIYLDYRIIEPMQEFVQAARDQGLSVLLASGYRSYEEQSWLFDMQVEMYGDEEEAATIVARPGTSEHQTGLAADITDDYYEIKNDELENTELYKWMSTHCQDYGFIVRFPKGKEDVTGIIYEPWHFRYVGKEVASYIASHDLTLEEFLGLYEDLDATANVSQSSSGAGEENTSSSGELLRADPFGVPLT